MSSIENQLQNLIDSAESKIIQAARNPGPIARGGLFSQVANTVDRVRHIERAYCRLSVQIERAQWDMLSTEEK